jgi:threonine dehydrogenase-like Zn-dependent dehydrogenase
LITQLAAWSDATLRMPWEGLPMAYPGHIDCVYDTVGYPATVEVGVRVLGHGGKLVQLGVASPARFEWTPWYFKELHLIGSNAFGVEEVDGVRKHAIEHYLDLVQAGRVDLSGMLTHEFRLDQWRDALTTIIDQGETGAIKVAFDFR